MLKPYNASSVSSFLDQVVGSIEEEYKGALAIVLVAFPGRKLSNGTNTMISMNCSRPELVTILTEAATTVQNFPGEEIPQN